MTTGLPKRNLDAVRLGSALLAATGVLALAACDQRAEPRPAYEAAPPPPPAPLAGEPEAAPTAAPPAGAPMAGPDAAPSLAPPEGAAPPPPQGPPPPPPHDEGLVAMAPIPNPEDGGPAPPYAARPPRPTHHARSHAAPPRRIVRRHPRRAAAPTAAVAPRRAAPAPHAAPPHGPAPAPHAAPPPVHKAPVKPPVHATPVAAPAKPATHHERRASKAELRQSKAHREAKGGNTTGNTTGADADARTEALRAALSTAVAKGAVLTAPKASADQAADVTLTLPASFYDTLKTEAGKQAMGDAAASANADATLTGDGYAIIPAGAQAQPLRAGQPTTFHWTVTAPAGAKGPLRADVKVDLLGGGSQVLALGAVDQADAQGAGFRWWGAALLIAVVALGLWWLLRTRSADARIAASRKRAKRPNGTINGQRPLDLRPDDDVPPR